MRDRGERHCNFYEDIPAMAHSIDSNGRLVRVSDRWLETLGYEREEVIGRKSTEFLTDDSRRYAEESVLPEFFRTGRCRDVPYQFVKKNGDIVDVLLSASCERESGGNIFSSRAILVDVSERNRAEEGLRNSERLFRAIFEEHNAMMVLVEPETGRIVRANKAALDFYGYPAERFTAMTVFDFNVSPDDEIRNALYMASRKESTVHVFRHKLANGEVRTVEVHGSQIVIDNQILRFSIIHDITCRKHMEDELRRAREELEKRVRERTAELAVSVYSLRKSEKRYRLLFENMVDGLACCRMLYDDTGNPADFVYIDVNSAFGRLSGFENVVGKRVSELIPGIREAHPELFDIYGRVAMTGRPERFEIEIAFLGKWFSVSAYSTQKDHFVAIFEDITARKRTEFILHDLNEKLELRVNERTAELTDANELVAEEIAERKLAEERLRGYARRISEMEEELRKKLAAELHDEIGRDLTALGINCSIISDTLPEDIRKTLGLNIEDSRRLIEEVTCAVRNIMNRLRPPMLDDYGLPAALRWYADLFSRRTGIAVRVLVDETCPRLTADKETALFRIAQEALTNTSKHAAARNVVVMLVCGAGKLRLSIADDGKGFADEPTSTFRAASGWGLTIMRERAELFGGSFRVDSAPGAGTTVTVEIREEL